MQDSTVSSSSLGIAEWMEYARKGASFPIHTQLHGWSMEPLIRYMKDDVTIIPLAREPIPGDIVLFHRADGAYVVHRVWRVSADRVQTWGDNCVNPDAPLKREDVLGLVTARKRNGKTLPLDTDAQRAYGLRWMKYGRRPWFFCRRLRGLAGRMIRIVYPDFHKKNAQ